MFGDRLIRDRRQQFYLTGLAVFVLISCGSTATGSEFDLTEVLGDDEVYRTGLDLYLEDQVGLTVANALGRAHEIRAEYVRRCMSEAGFEVLPELLTTSENQRTSMQALYQIAPNAADKAEVAIDSWVSEDGGVSPPASAEQERRMFACTANAEQLIPSPVDRLVRWWETIARNADAEISSDPRVVGAERELATCVGASGYPDVVLTDLASSFTDRARSIVFDLQDGRIDESEARNLVRELRESEHVTFGVLTVCHDTYIGAVMPVRAEVELRTLEAHADAARQAASDVMAELSKLDDVDVVELPLP